MTEKHLDFSHFFTTFGGINLSAGISLTPAGTMNPFCEEGVNNRKKFFSSMDISPEDVCFCKQIHSRTVFNADNVELKGREGDGMITSRQDILLSVTAADCMPVYIYDPVTGCVGLCHSGWKGTGIALEALKLMGTAYGTRPEDVHILLGPAIGSCCYQVDRDRAAFFRSEWGEGAAIERNGSFFLDLRQANRDLLARAGVKNVHSASECTRCNSKYSSFRREGPENYTRMAAWMGL